MFAVSSTKIGYTIVDTIAPDVFSNPKNINPINNNINEIINITLEGSKLK